MEIFGHCVLSSGFVHGSFIGGCGFILLGLKYLKRQPLSKVVKSSNSWALKCTKCRLSLPGPNGRSGLGREVQRWHCRRQLWLYQSLNANRPHRLSEGVKVPDPRICSSNVRMKRSSRSRRCASPAVVGRFSSSPTIGLRLLLVSLHVLGATPQWVHQSRHAYLAWRRTGIFPQKKLRQTTVGNITIKAAGRPHDSRTAAAKPGVVHWSFLVPSLRAPLRRAI